MINLKKGAFTLVELIVVITILAILWTIAFLSFQWYSRDARDAVRISDIDNIVKSMNFYEIQRWQYPIPSNWIDITYSWAMVWNQGTVWDSVINNLSQLSKKPVDPLTQNEYTFSRLNTKKEFQVAAILEWWLIWEAGINFVSSANASDSSLSSYIKWNYNWILAKVSTWSQMYILAVPSIISSDITLVDVVNLIQSWSLSYNWTNNLPSSYSWNWFNLKWGWFDYSPSSIVVYEWGLDTLKDSFNQLRLAIRTQDAYRWSDIYTRDDWVKKLIDTTIKYYNPTEDIQYLVTWLISNSVDPSVSIENSSYTIFWCDWLDWSKSRNEGWYYNWNTVFNYWAYAVLKSDGSITTWWDWAHWWTWAPTDNWYVKIFSTQSAFAAIKSDGSIYAWWDGDYWWTWAPTDKWYVNIFSTLRAFAAMKSDGSITTWWYSTYWVDGTPTDSWYTTITSSHNAFAALRPDWTINAWWLYGWTWEPVDAWYVKIYSRLSAFLALKEDWTGYYWWSNISDWPLPASASPYVDVFSTQQAFAVLKEDWSIFTQWTASFWWSWWPTGTWYVNIYPIYHWWAGAFAAIKSDWSISVWWWVADIVSEAPSWSWFLDIASNARAYSALHEDGSIYAWWSDSEWWNQADVPSWNNFVNIFSNYYAFAALTDTWEIKTWGHVNNWWTWWPVDSWYTKIFSTDTSFAAIKNDWSVFSWWNSSYWWTWEPTDAFYIWINWGCND